MRTDLLLILADFLERPELSEPGKFDLSSWMCSYGSMLGQNRMASTTSHMGALMAKAKKAVGRVFKRDGTKFVLPIDCQTAGCAIGWAATIPEFREAGLRLLVKGNDNENLERASLSSPVLIEPGTENIIIDGSLAVSKLLGLTLTSMEHLFFPKAYPMEERSDPKAVARRIRNFVGVKPVHTDY